MKANVFRAPGKFGLEEKADPESRIRRGHRKGAPDHNLRNGHSHHPWRISDTAGSHNRTRSISRPKAWQDDLPSPVRPLTEDAGLSASMLEDTERRLISDALAKASGNQSEAARLLRIGRDALRYKMKKYGLAGSASTGSASTGSASF